MKHSAKSLQEFCSGTIIEQLGIEFISFEEGKVVASLPVDHRTIQPLGLLHGGASATLAETLGSIGSQFLIDQKSESAVGVELNINHLRSRTSGKVIGTANILHKGRKIHVWDIRIEDEEQKMVATSRLTVMIIQK